jgi:3-hydroxyacyl-CoA dehydrogenase
MVSSKVSDGSCLTVSDRISRFMFIDADKQGSTLVLRMSNGPANVLSIGNGMAASLADAIMQARHDKDCDAIVLAGSGKMFCGGADLGDLDRAGDLRSLFEAIEHCLKPVVMAIHGMAFGGGLELILAGHLRIAAKGSRLALPEVRLGLLPGLGGTQRLPRLIGAGPSLDMMLSGAPMRAEVAAGLGLIDAIVDGDVVEAALVILRETNVTLRRTCDLAPPADIPEAVAARQGDAGRGLSRAPAHILHCVEAISADFAAGMNLEAALFDDLAKSPVSRGLRYVFSGQRLAMRVPGLKGSEKDRAITSAHIAGRGQDDERMAAILASAGLRVTQGDFPVVDHAEPGLLIILPGDSEALSRVDPARRSDVIVAQPRNLFEALRCDVEARPAQMFEYQCVNGGCLTEIIAGPSTAPHILAAILDVGKRTGKVFVVSGDRNGSIFERLLGVYAGQINLLLSEGVSPEQIDTAFEAWGMAEGPCKIMAQFDAALATIERPCSAFLPHHGVMDEEIVERFLLALIDEGARLVEDGTAYRPVDVDIVTIYGLGFPRERGGPMFQGDQIGMPALLDRTLHYADKRDGVV